MANLLPQHYVQTLKRERATRIVIVASVVLTVVVAITGLLVVPTYFVARNNEKNASQEIEVLRQVLETRESGDAQTEVRTLRAELETIKQMHTERSVITILDELFSVLPADVSVVNIVITEDTVQLDGVAGSRDSLLAYRKSIEENEMFGEIPVSINTLAKQFDVSFTFVTELMEEQVGAAAGEDDEREISGT